MGDTFKKNKGYADAEGVKFQLDLVIVSSLNAFFHHENWKVSSENKKAGKFDDIVIEFSDGSSSLVQAKHKKCEKTSITKEQFLLTKKNAEFGLPKYFFSYEEIKKELGRKTVIICTNKDIDDSLKDILTCHLVDDKNILNWRNKNYSFFKFNKNILPKLKQNVETFFDDHLKDGNTDKAIITDENLEGFLENLQIFSNYPSGDILQNIIDKLLSRFWVKISYHDIYRKIEEWLKQPVGEYLTKDLINGMLCEIISDRYWESLKYYKVTFEYNDFNFKELKRLFHVKAEGEYLLQILKIHHALRDSKSKQLFVNFDDGIKAYKQIIEAFGLHRYAILVMVLMKPIKENVAREITVKLREILEKNRHKKVILLTPSNNKLAKEIGLNDISLVDGSITFQDLSRDSQRRLLKKNVVFQGKTIILEELLHTQTTEDYAKCLDSAILAQLVKEKEVKVGAYPLGLDENVAPYYICRSFEKNIHEIERTEGIIPETRLCEVCEKMVLISDSAGTGKSTVLTKLATHINEKKSHLWIIRINLIDYSAILANFLKQNKNKINVTELLNSRESTKITNPLEAFVFAMKEKVVLMFDGVDEVSPDYTGLILSLLCRCQESPNFSKIFVATRPHEALKLESALKVASFKMLPFTKSNQVDFLTSYWSQNLQDYTNGKKCKQYAEILIDKISSWIKSYHYSEINFAAIPMQVNMLAEIFQSNMQRNKPTDWEGCKEYLEGEETAPNLPETFNIVELYEMFIKKKQDAFVEKGNSGGNTVTHPALYYLFNGCLAHHRSQALRMILSESEGNLFTSCYPKDKDDKENVLKMGIVQRFGNEFQFIHRTFAEYFVAKSIVRELKRQNPNIEFQRLLIDKILIQDKFEVVCVFLDLLLQKVFLPPNIFKNYRSYKGECNLNLIFHLARQGHVTILDLILKSINFEEIQSQEIKISDWRLKITFKTTNTLNGLKVLTRKAGVNIRGQGGETPLHFAVRGGHLEMVSYLIKAGADVYLRNNNGSIALHLAAELGMFHIVKHFVQHYPDVKFIKDGMGHTAFHLAALHNRLNTVKYLVKQGAVLEDRDSEGRTALHLAADWGRLNTVDYLVRQGAMINSVDYRGHTPAHLAAQWAHLITLEYLVDHGADINIRDHEGCKVTDVPARWGRLNTLKHLVEHGAVVHATDSKGCAAIHLTKFGHLNTLKYLVEHGATVNVRHDEGCIPLYLAAEYNRLNTVKFLTEQGAALSTRDNKGHTAIQFAVETGYSSAAWKKDGIFKKNRSCCDAEGVKFQADLRILSFLNAFLRHENWKVSSGNKRNTKFDIVFEYLNGTSILIQSKHIKSEENSITKEQFLSTKKNAQFGLPECFFTYQEIKNKLGRKTVIICTNKDINNLEDILTCHQVSTENILDCGKGNYSFSKFNKNILPELKKNVGVFFDDHLKDGNHDRALITDENLDNFLENLQIFSNYPSGDELKNIIDRLLSRLGVKISYHDLYTKVEEWLMQAEGEYLTKIDVNGMLCEIISDKYCKSLKDYNVSFECNNLNFKESKRIFHVKVKEGYLLSILKIFRALQDNKSKNLFVNFDDDIKSPKQMIEAFGLPRYAILVMVLMKPIEENVVREITIKLREILENDPYKKVILVAPSNNKLAKQIGLNDISLMDGSLTFQDLSRYSQRWLLNKNVVFQGKTISLAELLRTESAENQIKSLNSAVLAQLLEEEEVKVGVQPVGLDDSVAPYYIRRTFEKNMHEMQITEGAIPEKQLYEVCEKVVLISDSAGMGKSTVLTKLAGYINENKPNVWVIRINLKNYTGILRDCLRRNKNKINVMELLNSEESTKIKNPLEAFVFSMTGKVVLIFDGVDEICPDYTGLILGLLCRCQESLNFLKIFVATRPHVTLKLELALKVESFKMLPFTRSNQVDFLTRYWSHNLQLDYINKRKCKQYAEKLIDKMSAWINRYPEINFAPIPMQVNMLAEIFQTNKRTNKATHWEGCMEYIAGDRTAPKLPEKFNIAELYEMFIEKKRDVFVEKSSSGENTVTPLKLLDQFKKCLVGHRKQALSIILSETESNLFTSCHPQDKITEECILNIGIMQRFGDEFQFVHTTFAEYFVAKSIVQELKLHNRNANFQRLLIDKILVQDRFEIVCVFLDFLLQKVSLPPNIFKKYRSYKCECNHNLIFHLARQGYVTILELILKSINFGAIRRKEINITNLQVKIVFKTRNTLNGLKVLARKAGINIRGQNGETPLHAAVRGSHLDMVNYLIKLGADVYIKNNNGSTALHLATELGISHIVNFFVRHCPDVNFIKDGMGRTALQLAALNYDLNTVKYLVEHGAVLEDVDNEGYTALLLAAKWGRLNTVDYLVRQGAKINSVDNRGRTPVHLTAKWAHLTTLEYLVEHGAVIDTRDGEGCTAMILAARWGHLNTLKYLVEHGAVIDTKDNEGCAAIHLTAKWGRLNTLKYLVEQGATVNARDDEGYTPLHLAAKYNRLNAVKFLVEYRADLNIRDNKGRTALQLATETGNLSIVKYLNDVNSALRGSYLSHQLVYTKSHI